MLELDEGFTDPFGLQSRIASFFQIKLPRLPTGNTQLHLLFMYQRNLLWKCDPVSFWWSWAVCNNRMNSGAIVLKLPPAAKTHLSYSRFQSGASSFLCVRLCVLSKKVVPSVIQGWWLLWADAVTTCCCWLPRKLNVSFLSDRFLLSIDINEDYLIRVRSLEPNQTTKMNPFVSKEKRDWEWLTPASRLTTYLQSFMGVGGNRWTLLEWFSVPMETMTFLIGVSLLRIMAV